LKLQREKRIQSKTIRVVTTSEIPSGEAAQHT